MCHAVLMLVLSSEIVPERLASSSEKLIRVSMKLKNISVYHREDDLKIWIIFKDALQTIEMGHRFSDLRVCIQKLVEYLYVVAG